MSYRPVLIYLDRVGFRPAIACVVTAIVILSLPTASDAQTIAAGDGHTVVLKSDGTVWTFGLNNQGQLCNSISGVVCGTVPAYKRFGGRKKEPEWSDVHAPDWKWTPTWKATRGAVCGSQ